MKKYIFPICAGMMLTLVTTLFPLVGIASADQTADGWIMTALAYTMERDGRLSPGRVDVACHDGVIALHGTVFTEEDRGLAEQLALLIPGVLGIENDLSVAAVDEDGRLAQEIRSELLEQPSVRIRALTVRTQEGVVTLTGVVQDRRQRRMADRLVLRMPQVRQVVDDLTVLRAA